MEFDLAAALGKNTDSKEVQSLIKKYDISKIKKSPPDRRYFCAEKNGVSLVVNGNTVTSVQIYVHALKPFKAFSAPLPFELLAEMDQKQVHKKLGSPKESSEFDSQYDRPEIGAKLIIEYDEQMKVSLISLGILKVS